MALKLDDAFQTADAGIGADGACLRSMLEESERLFAETGYYCGLESLPLKESAPIRYEKMHSRLRGGVVTSRETAMRVAASPLVANMGEVCFVLCTAEGDSVAVSTGIIVHVNTMSQAIKYMVRNDYEDNPGIKPGDIFVNNDCRISNVHPADVQTHVPIFHEGELVAWASGVTHEFDVGATVPGSSTVGPINRFEDGIDLPALRCGENDRLHRDYVDRCMNRVRTPEYWMLDERTRLAGCHMIRQLALEMIADEGVDTFKQLLHEAVEDGRRSFTARVRRTMVPGKYRAPVFVDCLFADEPSLPPEAAVDTLFHIPVAVDVTAAGTLNVGLRGANEWGLHCFNCTPEAIRGGLWAVLAQTFMSNDVVNDGASFAVGLDLPLGSWANPGHQLTAHTDAWYPLTPLAHALAKPLSRGYLARGYLEEIIAGWGSPNMLQGGQLSDSGIGTAVCNMEVVCSGGGAGLVADGLDYASIGIISVIDMGDIEDWESMEPLIYLGRTVKCDSAGAGRYRGGLGFDSLRMVVDPCSLQNHAPGKVFDGSGLFGGYPPGTAYRHNLHDTALPEMFAARQPYPTADWEGGSVPAGEEQLDDHTNTLLESYCRHDLYLSVIRGGPGAGDPIEREPAAVEADLRSGVLSARLARNVYGVETTTDDAGRAVVNIAATETQRGAIREQRAARGVPVADWMERERERVLEGRFVPPIKNMYRSSMKLSDSWATEYRDFWNLPSDFEF